MTERGSEILGASVPLYARLVGESRQEIPTGVLRPRDRVDSIARNGGARSRGR